MGNSQPCFKGVEAAFVAPKGGVFADVKLAPADPILNTTALFKKDTDPNKINLGVGAYRTEQGKPYILPVVKSAETELMKDIQSNQVDKEYSTIDGPPLLKTLTQKLTFGDAASIKEERIASAQTLSGTGSLRVCAGFMKAHMQPASHTIWISDPTWGNHPTIFQKEGFTVKTYKYFDAATKGLNFAGMIADLKSAQPGNAVLLHACAHNPTGVDPTKEQWQEILELCQSKPLIPILDSAYQGYASGDLDNDAYSCRLFEKAGVEMFMCQSFAKNLGLYGERIGMLHVVCKEKAQAESVLSQLKMVIRPMYSSPPIHGAQLVMKILGDEGLYAQWKKELKLMAERILKVRNDLKTGLEQKGCPGKWNHVTDQIGMFSYTGLTEPQCERLISKHHIYLLKSGRISLAGLNDSNINYMINAVDEVVRNS
jgi:aspartate aminotransferase